jgi:hypothetical protein
MPRGLVVILAAGAVVAVAAVEGVRSNRWGSSAEVAAAAARLEKVPREFGDWAGTDAAIDPKVLRVAEAAGSVSRRYANRRTGEWVDVLLLCGPSGPIGSHTPEACYGGLGYACEGKPVQRAVVLPGGEVAGTFWTARFEKKSRADDPLRLYWAWGVGGEWEASPAPRGDFAMRPALYKLYAVRVEDGTRAPSPGPDPLESFLVEFLPLVRAALNPEAG